MNTNLIVMLLTTTISFSANAEYAQNCHDAAVKLHKQSSNQAKQTCLNISYNCFRLLYSGHQFFDRAVQSCRDVSDPCFSDLSKFHSPNTASINCKNVSTACYFSAAKAKIPPLPRTKACRM